MEWSREQAVDRVERLVETIESEQMPVPVRELWVFGDLALGLDPVERLDLYLTKDILLADSPDREAAVADSHDVRGVGRTIRAEWAKRYPEHLRAGSGGYAAPERCLAAHLLEGDEPVHLEVCNASFDDNVTQRLEGAIARERYEALLDPRGVCLWREGERSPSAFGKLRAGEYVFPTLPEALGMLGLDESQAREAAAAVKQYRERQQGTSVRGDVV